MKRHGFTLVELLVVMAILSVVMGISVTLMFMMFDFQQRYSEQSEQLRSTNRFIEQFRDDARLGYAPLFAPDDETLLQWSEGDNKITFSLVPGKFSEKQDVIRRTWLGDALTATEIYHLPDHAVLRFVLGQDANIGLLALSLVEQPPFGNMIPLEKLDPFTRTLYDPQPNSPDPNVTGYWRTVIVRIAQSHETAQETGGTP